jgi:hypothetical protein
MECASSSSSDEWELELEECAAAILINNKKKESVGTQRESTAREIWCFSYFGEGTRIGPKSKSVSYVFSNAQRTI